MRTSAVLAKLNAAFKQPARAGSLVSVTYAVGTTLVRAVFCHTFTSRLCRCQATFARISFRQPVLRREDVSLVNLALHHNEDALPLYTAGTFVTKARDLRLIGMTYVGGTFLAQMGRHSPRFHIMLMPLSDSLREFLSADQPCAAQLSVSSIWRFTRMKTRRGSGTAEALRHECPRFTAHRRDIRWRHFSCADGHSPRFHVPLMPLSSSICADFLPPTSLAPRGCQSRQFGASTG